MSNIKTKAIGFQKSLAISEADSLVDIQVTKPQASGRDILVKVKAISVNPVDYKIRQNMPPENGEFKVIGWDAVGVVEAVGNDVSLFSVGDEVYYAGDLTRDGSNAEYQLVDERIVGRKPKSINDAQAAALPLTAITAWELLFNGLSIPLSNEENGEDGKPIILVIGAAGGVGSIFIQLAKVLTNATIIASASREASANWVKDLGADFVVDHTKDLVSQVKALNIGDVSHVASLNGTEKYVEAFTEVLKPFGKIGLIDDPSSFNIGLLKRKCISLHWEFMFTRSMFTTSDMIEQHNLLNQVAELIDQGKVKTTLGKNLGKICAENLKQAHSELESGTAIGKLVLEGF